MTQHKESQNYVLSILVDNQPGVLSRIVGLFSGRGYNIESLCVAPTVDGHVSKITLTTHADPLVMEQIGKQLNKLINVIKVSNMTESESIQRELALICVKARNQDRAEILRIADIFKCKIIKAEFKHYILEVTGDEKKIKAIIDLLKPIGITKMSRTGLIAL